MYLYKMLSREVFLNHNVPRKSQVKAPECELTPGFLLISITLSAKQ